MARPCEAGQGMAGHGETRNTLSEMEGFLLLYIVIIYCNFAYMGCKGCKQMSPAEKISSIVTGWKNVIWKSPEIEKEAIRRVKICADCSHNRNTFCSQCGCWIPAKARSMQEVCPINKWNDGK